MANIIRKIAKKKKDIKKSNKFQKNMKEKGASTFERMEFEAIAAKNRTKDKVKKAVRTVKKLSGKKK